MITVQIRPADGWEDTVRVTAASIAEALRICPGEVIFPIDPEDYFYAAGPPSFYAVEVMA